MAITVLSDVILPTSLLTSGVRGKQMRNNTRSEASNGSAIVNINWSKTLRQYELGCVPMTVAQWQTLEGLHEVTEGGAYGFLLPDPKDSTVASGAGLLQGYNSGLVGTVGFGYGVPTYKLMKRYSVAGSTRTKDRQITRPQTTPVMLRAGGGIVLGSGSGQAAFTLTTGSLTFVADYSTGVTSYTVGASTILNFGSGTMAGLLAVSGRIYLSGVSGTEPAPLRTASSAAKKSNQVAMEASRAPTVARSNRRAGWSATRAAAARPPARHRVRASAAEAGGASTGWKREPGAMSASVDRAAGRRSSVLGAMRTSGLRNGRACCRRSR